MKRILIVGSKGMAGHMISHYLNSSSNFIIGELARSEDKKSGVYNVDVTSLGDLSIAIHDFLPDIIINCIGILNKEAEENPDIAVFLNSYLPHFLAKKISSTGGKLIHISTDCVFSGKKGSSYQEQDVKDGIGFYAQSKALGEVIYDQHLTIRTSIIGPEIKTNGIGLLHWFLKNEDNAINGYTNALWGGVTTLQLAKSIFELINDDSTFGLIHLTNNHPISKHDLLLLFKEAFSKEVDILPNDGYIVDKSLVSTRILPKLTDMPSYNQMIYELKCWMKEFPELYANIYKL